MSIHIRGSAGGQIRSINSLEAGQGHSSDWDDDGVHADYQAPSGRTSEAAKHSGNFFEIKSLVGMHHYVWVT